MNFAHLHLVLTHFAPVMSAGATLSAAAGFLPRRRADFVTLALLLIIGTGAFMPVTYYAGNRVADTIGRVDGIDQNAIAPHQRAAAIALTISTAAALIALALLIIVTRSGRITVAIRIIVFATAALSTLTIGWTANLGGAIHHPEIGTVLKG